MQKFSGCRLRRHFFKLVQPLWTKQLNFDLNFELVRLIWIELWTLDDQIELRTLPTLTEDITSAQAKVTTFRPLLGSHSFQKKKTEKTKRYKNSRSQRTTVISILGNSKLTPLSTATLIHIFIVTDLSCWKRQCCRPGSTSKNEKNGVNRRIHRAEMVFEGSFVQTNPANSTGWSGFIHSVLARGRGC